MRYDAIETGKRIQRLRKEMGLTQEQLANKISITDRHLRNIETGERSASIETLVTLSELFCTSLDYLILGRQSQSQIKKELNTMIQNLSSMVERL